MDIHFDGLTGYCVDGAWRMSDLSPLTYSFAMHVPYGYHGVDYDGIAEGSIDCTMMDTNCMMNEALKKSNHDIRCYIASYTHWHMLEWMLFISQRVSSELVNKVEKAEHQCSLSNHFEAYRCTNLIPNAESYEQLLSPIVVENALTAYMQSYIGDWWQETIEFLGKYHQENYDCQPVEERFLLHGYQLTKVNHQQRFRAQGLLPSVNMAAEKKRIKTAKKAIARGRKLFEMLINGKQTVDAFISGEEIDVKGSIFDYTVRKTYGLLDKRATFKSIPYSLTLFDKDSGLELARLCVYFDNTPILDQVYGFLMYISAGAEYEKRILETANVFMPTEAGRKSEKLKKYTNYREFSPVTTDHDFGLGTIDLETMTIEKIDLKAILAVFMFHKLVAASGLHYPQDCLNGCIRELVDKTSFESLSMQFLAKPNKLLTNFRGNYGQK